MATTKDVAHGSLWYFDATGQAEGLANASITGDEAPVFDTVRPYIRAIRVKTTGTAGAVLIRESSSGRKILDIPSMDPNTIYEETFENYFEGIYISTLPASAIVVVKHGQVSPLND